MRPRTRQQRRQLDAEMLRGHLATRATTIVPYSPEVVLETVELDDTKSSDSSSGHAKSKSTTPESAHPDEDEEDIEFEEANEGEESNHDGSARPYEDLTSHVLKHRQSIEDLEDAYPDLSRPTNPPFSLKFLTIAGSVRYESLRLREFTDQKYLPLGVKDLKELEKILETAGLIHTVLDIPRYIAEVVREFYANLPDIEVRGGFHLVYVRGQMYDFDSKIINEMFKIGFSEEDSEELLPVDKTIDEIVSIVTGGLRHRWEDLQAKFFTPTMAVLHQVCCHNWMPSANRSKPCQDRLKMMYLVATDGPFDFGRIIYTQIMKVALAFDKIDNKLPFPNLIFQLLEYFREVPVYARDHQSRFPLAIALDSKASSGHFTPKTSGTGKKNEAGTSTLKRSRPRTTSKASTSGSSTLATDLRQLGRLIRDMQLKCSRGEYGGDDDNEVEG